MGFFCSLIWSVATANRELCLVSGKKARVTQIGFSKWGKTGSCGRNDRPRGLGHLEQGQGLQELSVQDGETTFHAPERAEQRVLGVSHQLMSGLDLRVEAYERLSSHLRPHWENVDDPDNIFPESQYDRIR